VLVPPAYTSALCLQASSLMRMNSFDAFIRIIQTLGVASTVLCLIAAWFSRQPGTVTISDPVLEPAPAVFDTTSSPPGQKEGATL